MAAVLPMEVISMVFIAAELGANFRDFREVKRMIGLAKDAGVDGVKFQVFRDEHIKGHPREAELHDLILKQSDIQFLRDTADECGIEFFATPMYPEAVDMLEAVGVKRYKIRYADRCNKALISRVVKTDKSKPIFLSMDDEYMDQDYFDEEDFERLHFVYCVPEYPPERVDLPVFCDEPYVGYSNHYPSISVPLAAAARGAEYIEVHVKQDKYPKGYKPIDDAVSLTFSDLKELVRLTREIEKVIL